MMGFRFVFPFLVLVTFTPLSAESVEGNWRIDEDYTYELSSSGSSGLEEVNKTVDEIRIYKRSVKGAKWDAELNLLDEKADYRTVDRREIDALLGGIQDQDADLLSRTDICDRYSGVWTFHTFLFDQELRRLAYVRIEECVLGAGISRPREAGRILQYSTVNITSTSSRSIIRIMRELGVPGM